VGRVLQRGFETIELRRWDEADEADTVLQFQDTSAVLDFLHPFMDDPWARGSLRHVLTEELAYTGIMGWDDGEVLEQLAWRIVRGHIKLFRLAPSQPAIQAGILTPAGPALAPEGSSGNVEEAQPVAPAAIEKRTSWIEIELVDEEGRPVARERYRVELPGGSIREGRLDVNGLARIDGIEPGTCKISFPDLDARKWQRA
jgi:hypothetical protein